MLRPSTRVGWPAFGIAESGFFVNSSIRSSVSSVGFGPTEQFSPITSAGSWSRNLVNVSVSAPSCSRPSSSAVTCAITAISGPAASRAAATASRSSGRLENVSKISRSTPSSSSASICSRNIARASSNDVGPSGSMCRPSGPTAPATNTWLRSLAASRASRTPARLMSATLSASP